MAENIPPNLAAELARELLKAIRSAGSVMVDEVKKNVPEYRKSADAVKNEFNDFKKTVEKHSSTYSKAMKKISESVTLQGFFINHINKNFSHFNNALKNVKLNTLEDAQQLAEINRALIGVAKATHGNMKDMERARGQLDKIYESLSEAEHKVFDPLFKQIAEWDDELETGTLTLEQYRKKVQQTTIKTSATLNHSAKQSTTAFAQVISSIKSQFKIFGKELTTTSILLGSISKTTVLIANLGRALKLALDQTRDFMMTGFVQDKGSKITTPWTQAMSLGISARDLIEVQAANRQMVSNIGSSSKWLDQIVKGQERYFQIVGDNVVAARMFADASTMFAKSGLSAQKSFQLAIKDNAETFDFLHKTIGASVEDYQGMMADLTQDANLRWQLITASQNEREEILRGIMMRTKERAAMGMNIDQIKAAEKAMRGIAGLSPKDRFKKASQLQMMMGVYGVGGGEEAARLMREGPQRWKPGDQERLQKSLSALNDAVAGEHGGTYGGEFAAYQMTQGLGMPELVGPNSAMITTLNTGVSFQKETVNQLTYVNKWLNKASGWYQTITSWFTNNPVFNAIISIGGLLLNLIGIAKLGGMLGGGIGKIGGMLGKIPGAGKVAGAAGGLLKSGGKLAGSIGMGALKGLGRGLPGIALTAASMMAPQDSLVGKILGSNAATGAGLGMTIGSIIPGVGTLAGGLIGGGIGLGMDAWDYFTKPKAGQPSVTQEKVAEDAKQVKENIDKSADLLSSILKRTEDLIEVNKKILEIQVAHLDQAKLSKEEEKRLQDLGIRLGRMENSASGSVLASS